MFTFIINEKVFLEATFLLALYDMLLVVLLKLWLEMLLDEWGSPVERSNWSDLVD